MYMLTVTEIDPSIMKATRSSSYADITLIELCGDSFEMGMFLTEDKNPDQLHADIYAYQHRALMEDDREATISFTSHGKTILTHKLTNEYIRYSFTQQPKSGR